MANEIVTITEKPTDNKGWYNIHHNGKDIGINVSSNPKIVAAINSGQLNVEMNVVEKNGKWYGWDVKEQKQGGGFQKKDPEAEALKQRMIIAQSSVSSAVQYYQQRQPNSSEDIFILADKIYNWVIEKSK